jgi:isocitrate dehydrogenase
MGNSKIIYTLTDEAPLLATNSLLPIIRGFAATADIDVVESDISVAARIIAEFSDFLTDAQKLPNNLAELGRLTQDPDTNIIKLPNISASIPQLISAVHELQEKGFKIPDYPEEPKSDEELAIQKRYSKIQGSAVNPVLREGNSDRRAPPAVKRNARKNPHSMAKWSPASRTHVSHMHGGDFYTSEKCMTMDKACTVKMDLKTNDGEIIVLKEKTELLEGEIIDSMFMSAKALCEFLEYEMEDARLTGVMFSLHVKATMMKVSHPIVFGHAVKVFYKDLFAKYGDLFEKLGVNPNNGISSVYEKIASLPSSFREEIEHDIHACYEARPEIAMVDSTKGISNLHAPNDVIVDASMPAMIRNGGKMYGPDGKSKDTKAVIPESTYARIFQEVISFCKTNGAFDPTTMGTVPNVGLMAQKAEEYGSHDKTFEISADGVARIIDEDGKVLIEQDVERAISGVCVKLKTRRFATG